MIQLQVSSEGYIYETSDDDDRDNALTVMRSTPSMPRRATGVTATSKHGEPMPPLATSARPVLYAFRRDLEGFQSERSSYRHNLDSDSPNRPNVTSRRTLVDR